MYSESWEVLFLIPFFLIQIGMWLIPLVLIGMLIVLIRRLNAIEKQLALFQQEMDDLQQTRIKKS